MRSSGPKTVVATRNARIMCEFCHFSGRIASCFGIKERGRGVVAEVNYFWTIGHIHAFTKVTVVLPAALNEIASELVILKVDQGKLNFLRYQPVNVLFGEQGPFREDGRGVEERKEFSIVHDIDLGFEYLEEVVVEEFSILIRHSFNLACADKANIPTSAQHTIHYIFLVLCQMPLLP